MKTYTFEDWLTGKFDANDLTTLCAKKLISQEDYNKIREAQEKAFDASFILTFETFKRMFSAKVSSLSTDKSIAYLEGMRDYYKRYIERKNIHSPTIFDSVRLGFKCFDGIEGYQYREMETAWKGFKNGKIKYVTNYLNNDYLELFTNYSIHKWLEEYATRKQQKNQKITDSFKTNLNIENLEYLFHNLKGECIANDTDLGLFKDVFSSVPIDSLSGKIKWIESVPLFVALFLGFEEKKYDGLTYTFKGILIPTGDYLKKITYCFEFKQRVTNKTLSSTIQKVSEQNSIRNITKILPITEKF